MQIEITMTENAAGRFYELATEKGAMSVSVCKWYVSVCAHNSAAAINRNLGGRVFHGPDALATAIASYKSGASKVMLDAVMSAERERNEGATKKL